MKFENLQFSSDLLQILIILSRYYSDNTDDGDDEVLYFVGTSLLASGYRAGSDGRLSASGSAGLRFDPRRDSKFSSTSGLGGVEMYIF